MSCSARDSITKTAALLALAAGVLVWAGCSKSGDKPQPSAKAETFSCQKRNLTGPWRDCSPTSKSASLCDDVECFERPTAFCFPALFSMTGEVWTICTATEKECDEWNEDRKTVPNKSLGPCVESRPDEFIELGAK